MNDPLSNLHEEMGYSPRLSSMSWGSHAFPVIVEPVAGREFAVFTADCLKYYAPDAPTPWQDVDYRQTTLVGQLSEIWWFDSDGDHTFETGFVTYRDHGQAIFGVGFDYLPSVDPATQRPVRQIDTFWDIGAKYWEIHNKNFWNMTKNAFLGGIGSMVTSTFAGMFNLFTGRSYYELIKQTTRAATIAAREASEGGNYWASLGSQTLQYSTGMWQRLYDLAFQRRYAAVMDLTGDRKNVGYDMGGGTDLRYHHSVGAGLALGTSEVPLGHIIDGYDYDQAMSVDGKVGPFLLDVQQALGKHKAIQGASATVAGTAASSDMHALGIKTAVAVNAMLWLNAAGQIASRAVAAFWCPPLWADFATYSFFALALPAGLTAAYVASETLNTLYFDPSTGLRYDDAGTPKYFRKQFFFDQVVNLPQAILLRPSGESPARPPEAPGRPQAGTGEHQPAGAGHLKCPRV